MPKNKTTETDASVADYVAAIKDGKRRSDFQALIEILANETKLAPKMWGSSIVGFGSYHYKYDSGHEGDAPLVGISSRSNAIVVYLCPDFDRKTELLGQLGKHKTSKACVYIQKLEDVDTGVLRKLVKESMRALKDLYPR